MSKVLDYSNWRPRSPAELVHAGILGVMRYIAPAAWHWPKAITPGELNALRAAGLAVGFNWETNGRSWRGGYDAGVKDGRTARAAMRELALADTLAVFQSADEPVPVDQHATLGEYQRGFNDGNGGRPQGFYGDVAAGHDLLDRGLIRYFWQANARAWPGSNIDSPRAVLIQRTSHSFPAFPANAYDENDVRARDWGQTPTPAAPPPNPQEVKVHPRFDPPLQNVVDALATGAGSWLLARDGGVFTDEGKYVGSMVNNPHFVGRHAARLVRPGEAVAGAHPPLAHYPASALYEIIAESGERYLPIAP